MTFDLLKKADASGVTSQFPRRASAAKESSTEVLYVKPGTAADPPAEADGVRFTRPFIPFSGSGFVFGRTIEF
jgi:hypothetical protein